MKQPRTKAISVEPNDVTVARRRWLQEAALPLWASAGWDQRRGGFHERLNLEGTPDRAANRRLRVQARQIYVYSHAFVLGWFDGKKLALEALEAMLRLYWSPDGRPGFVHLIDSQGNVADALRDCYDHMFVLLALAWAVRMSGDAQIHALIKDIISFIDEHLTAADGSFVEGVPARLPRRQNPHMHGLEAMLALKDTVEHPQALARARRIHDMLGEKFLDEESCTIGEYFTEAWVPLPGPSGEIVEPGHLAEWVWLLRRYEAATGAPPSSLPSRLLASALRWRDPATGFLIDEAARGGRVTRGSRRLWPQTELAKAWIGEAEAGQPEAAPQAGAILAALASHYLDKPFVGGWIDQFDAAGQPISGYVPASTLYHLFCAIAEADRVLRQPPSGA
jgi:mannose-6-phosphate isomerase